MSQTTNHPSNVTAFTDTQAKSNQSAIVVPCYNEEKRLDRNAFLAFLDVSPFTDFIFVNDGSRDETFDVLLSLRAAAPDRVTVVDLSRNSGKAEAVRQGLLAATDMGASYVGYWDADLATPLDAISDFTRVLTKFAETQVVFGSRRVMLGHRIERTIGRRIVSRICATIARQVVRLPIGDTQCGAKIMRNTPLLRNAIARPFSAGWLFDVELFARLSSSMVDRRFAFYEQPLAEWTEVAGSKVSAKAIISSGFRMLHLIAQIRLGLHLDVTGTETPPVATSVFAPSTTKVEAA